MPGPQVHGRLAAVVLCLVTALTAVVAVAWTGNGPGAPPVPGRPGATAGTGIDRVSGSRPEAARSVPSDPAAQIDPLLHDRAQAVLHGDRRAWLDGLDPAATPEARRFRAGQADLFDRLTSLHPLAWRYRVGSGMSLPSGRRDALGGDAWVADVQLLYRLVAGGPLVHRQQYLTIVRHDDRWSIAADTDGATGRDVWDLGPVVRSVAKRCVVIGARRRRAEVEALASGCDRAAATVDAAWGRAWPRRSLLTVPGTLGQLALLLGRSGSGPAATATPAPPINSAPPITSAPDATVGPSSTTAATGADASAGLEQTAALTVGPSGGPADQVLFNADAFARLSDLGRQVVLTHELVHVATRATGSGSAPTWLSEGYADHVAYAGTGLSADQVAGEVLDAVRAGRLPADLPGPADFDAAGSGAAAAYGGAWVAVDVIAARVPGAAGLKAFYQTAATGNEDTALDTALASTPLVDRAGLVTAWQAALTDLAGRAGGPGRTPAG